MFNRKKKQPFNNDKQVNKSHLQNLIALAWADGHLAEIEEHLLIAITHRLGLAEDDLEEIKSNVGSIEFVLPASYDDRIEQFNDLLTLISVDGHIDENELDFCHDMALKYELTEQVFQELIQLYS
ncbi:MAG: TerB family tellurite resistance protein [Cyclobacteriaceae bacterium]|nr:TerB family tellurite resistance protein [Cyclobacteriaceae bacterium]